MADELKTDCLTVLEVGNAADGTPMVTLIGSIAAIKRAARLFGEEVYLVPAAPTPPTDGGV